MKTLRVRLKWRSGFRNSKKKTTSLRDSFYSFWRSRKKPNVASKTAKQIKQLQEEKDVLADELKMLRKENTTLQKELNKVDQDGVSKNMAKVLKRYYEMEEQFGQMKSEERFGSTSSGKRAEDSKTG